MGCDGGGGVGCRPRFRANHVVSARLSKNANPLHYTKLAKGGAILKHHAPPRQKKRLYKETRNLLRTLVPQGLDPIPQLPAGTRTYDLHTADWEVVVVQSGWFNLIALSELCWNGLEIFFMVGWVGSVEFSK